MVGQGRVASSPGRERLKPIGRSLRAPGYSQGIKRLEDICTIF